MLSLDETVTLENGQVIRIEDIAFPTSPPRKMVILGDTCDPSNLLPLARGADIIVHECTLRQEEEGLCNARGHSTPHRAIKFAAECKAGILCINHISPKNSTSSILKTIYKSMHYASHPLSVVVSEDFMALNLFRLQREFMKDYEEAVKAEEREGRTGPGLSTPRYAAICSTAFGERQNIAHFSNPINMQTRKMVVFKPVVLDSLEAMEEEEENE
mgnify:CR=1 FL=1